MESCPYYRGKQVAEQAGRGKTGRQATALGGEKAGECLRASDDRRLWVVIMKRLSPGVSTGRPGRLQLRPGRAWLIQASEISAGKAQAF